MDRNFLAAFALSFLVLVAWMWIQGQYQPAPPPKAEQTAERPAPTPEVPPSWETSGAPPTPRPPAEPESGGAEVPTREVRISTDLYDAVLTSRGAGLLRWTLRTYDDRSAPGRPPVELTTLDEAGEIALASPLESLGAGDLSDVVFEVEETSDREKAFHYTRDGVSVRKIFSFEPGDYVVRVRLEVINASTRIFSPDFGLRWPARPRDSSDYLQQQLIALHEGGVERELIFAGQQTFGCSGSGAHTAAARSYQGDVEWAGMETRYFLALIIPEASRDAVAEFAPNAEGEGGATTVGFRPFPVAPGQSAAREYRVYVGPKETDRLAALGAGAERSVDMGWAWVAPLTHFFVGLLRALYSVIPNYGVAIILVTLLVRVAMAPLAVRQMRSMKRMSELQPKMKAIQEKYKDDRQLQSQKMMELYRSAGVNPLGGCLPMLVQFPVFIGLYYALQSVIELRQAPFVAWIDDLSVPEALFVIPGIELPLRVLPLLMGGSMWLQQKMTPATTMDPMQQRMMQTIMPVMFTFLFYQFASGLVLYWLVSNLLGIAHQAWMNRTTQASS
jgi:YidC/Oxa1 family membrane protein insertase